MFQFESSLATDKLRAMRCDRFEDLVATNALIRPGPLDSGMTDVYIRRKLGREPTTYPHPRLEDVLGSTYGIMTYQEQVMRMAQVLAGFTLAEADGGQGGSLMDAVIAIEDKRFYRHHGLDPRGFGGKACTSKYYRTIGERKGAAGSCDDNIGLGSYRRRSVLLQEDINDIYIITI